MPDNTQIAPLDAPTCSPSDIEGHPAMRRWNPTWKHHHTPMWFNKLIRKWAMKNGKWITGGGSWPGNYLPRFFDHWGSFKIDRETLVATQPYFGDFAEVERFAAEIGCIATTGESPAPWHPNTVLFIFRENKEL